MLIYNVTVNIDEDVHQDWLEWMKTAHIPEVMKCGLFVSHNLLKVMADDDGHTYSIQYKCESEAKLEEYFDQHAPRLQEDHLKRYKDKFVAFRTILEEVD